MDTDRIKIGTFAKLGQVTVKTLRYYDRLGLLVPDTVDPMTGYRYYSPGQLLTLRRIADLKTLGFTLKETKALLASDVSEEKITRVFEEKRAELERTLREARERLAEMNDRQRTIPRSPQTTEVPRFMVRSVEPVPAASIRSVIPRSQLCLLLDELRRHVREQGADPDRPLIVLWHAEAESGSVDVEVALPIEQSIAANERVRIGMLPGVARAASLLHHCNPYDEACPAAAELADWVARSGWRPSGSEPVREIYVTPDRDLYGGLRLAEMLMPLA